MEAERQLGAFDPDGAGAPLHVIRTFLEEHERFAAVNASQGSRICDDDQQEGAASRLMRGFSSRAL